MANTRFRPAPSKDAVIVGCPACGQRNRVAPARVAPSCGACGEALPEIRDAGRGDRPRAARYSPGKCGRRPGWWLRHGRRATVVATGLYAVALAAIWWLTTRVGEGWWLGVALLYAPRLLYAIPAPVLALLAVGTERRLLLAHAACLLFVLGPLMGWHRPGRGELPPAGTAPVRVLVYNVGAGPRAVAALRRAVDETSPNVVVAQETDDLAALFPGWTTHHAGEHFLATRLPIRETEQRALPIDAIGRRRTWMRYRLAGPRGAFTLFSIHLDTPRRGLEELKGSGWHVIQWRNLKAARRALSADAAWRARESAAARIWVAAAAGPRVVAGDFNQPPDSPLYRAHWGGFRDAFAVAGSGYGYTAHAPHPWVRIDRILVTPEWQVSHCRTLPGSGRDHLPMIADVWLR